MNNISAHLDVFLYELAVLVLAATLAYVAVALKKLTAIIKEDRTIWILPATGAVIMVLSLLSHAYASFSLFPALDSQIRLISSEAVLFDKDKLEAAKTAITQLKTEIVTLRAFSFLCFFISSFLLAAATGIYIRWISK